MALVHPVEPFEDPVFMISRDANAGISDRQFSILDLDGDLAAGDVVFDGIVTEIIDDLVEHSAYALNPETISGNLYGHILFSGTLFKDTLHIF